MIVSVHLDVLFVVLQSLYGQKGGDQKWSIEGGGTLLTDACGVLVFVS